VFDFVPQGVQLYVAGRNRAQKSENIKPYAGIRKDSDPFISKLDYTENQLCKSVFAFSVWTILADP